MFLAWATVFLLWGMNVWRAAGSVAFLFAAATVAVYTFFAALDLSREEGLITGAGGAILLILVVAVPAAFDPTSFDVFNITKYTLVVSGALALLALMTIRSLITEQAPRWRNGLHWPVLALLAWTGVTTLTSINVKASALGFYKSYDGLFTAIAVTVVFFAVVEFIPFDAVKRTLSIFFFGGGGLTALYGAMQLHDRLIRDQTWDWIPWGEAGFKNAAIWSSFGNPNHLAGFICILIPLGISLFLTFKDWRARALSAVIVVTCFLELLHTGTRGAWLGCLLSLVVVAALHLPEFKARPKLSLSLLGGSLAVLIAASVVLASAGILGRSVTGLLDFGPGTSVGQRIELWKSAVDMGVDKPIVGYGPDTYRVMFPSYQSATFVDHFGPNQVANGPHNIFMNYLAGQGVIGLAAFLVVITYAGFRGIGAWRRFRSLERRASVGDEARGNRFLTTGVIGSLVAYVGQASFNVQQVGLTFTFWVLLGILCVIALAAGVPATLNPRRLVSVDAEAGPPRDPRPPRRWTIPTPAKAALATVVALATTGVAWVASAPYRADRTFYDSQGDRGRAQIKDFSRGLRREHLRLSFEKTEEAIAINTWEALYMEWWAGSTYERAVGLLGPDGEAEDEERVLRDLNRSRTMYERALELQPRNHFILHDYATVLMAIDEIDPADGEPERTALQTLKRAYEANPWVQDVIAKLVLVAYNRGEVDYARDTLENGLSRIDTAHTLLEVGIQLYRQTGEPERAAALEERLEDLRERFDR